MEKEKTMNNKMFLPRKTSLENPYASVQRLSMGSSPKISIQQSPDIESFTFLEQRALKGVPVRSTRNQPSLRSTIFTNARNT